MAELSPHTLPDTPQTGTHWLNHTFKPQKPLIMGIINITPDSFSGDGLSHKCGTKTDIEMQSVQQALQMVTDGADLLDIGGESSRPGAQSISSDEEISRVLPALTAIRQKTSIPLSIDTINAATAAAALAAGATLINDISGGLHDPQMLPLAARTNAPIILMHNKASRHCTTQTKELGAFYTPPVYEDFLKNIYADLEAISRNALAQGVAQDKIILDPGLGFGKTTEQNLTLCKEIAFLHELSFPLLFGPSRKNFIGQILGLPVHDRLEGTAACVATLALLGADIIRVHDVKTMSRIAKMAHAIASA